MILKNLESNDFFLLKNNELNIPFSFLFLFSYLRDFSNKKKRLIVICVFEMFSITFSHFEKEFTQILVYDGCLNHF
jgi:hypothetical protein